jgi:thiamine-phosphate pyrophosphorylase
MLAMNPAATPGLKLPVACRTPAQVVPRSAFKNAAKMPISRPSAPLARLYLVTGLVAEPEEIAPALAAALVGIDIAAVLLRLATADDRILAERVEVIAPIVQQRHAALVLDGHPALVARTGADGAHLTGIDALTQSLPGLKPKHIAGAGGLRTRHDAMLAAEAGADYVMFGEPAAGRSIASVVERIAWWAEVFEPPCVGFAANFDEVGALAAAGADFVAVGDFIWNDARGPKAAISDATTCLRVPEVTG